MVITEKFLISKSGNLFDCEDLIFFNSNYAAVIDGATSRNNKVYNGVSTGRTAAELVYEALDKLSPAVTLREVLNIVTKEFSEFYNKNGIDITNYANVLTASCVIYSRYFNQIWMIGDCQCLFDNKAYTNKNGIDNFVSMVRSFINQAEILKGHTKAWITENDPGAKYISYLLSEQFVFQNHSKMTTGEFGYSAFDGRAIDIKSVKVLQLGKGTTEFVLASDGYPSLKPSVKETEVILEKMLIKDPLCIYINKSVKGVKNEFISYDDRAYLKVRL